MKSLIYTLGIGVVVSTVIVVCMSVFVPMIESIHGTGIFAGFLRMISFLVAFFISLAIGSGICFGASWLFSLNGDGGGPPDFDDPNVG